jgi:glycosyltransferase involved in cell wall biosynthesis
MIIGIDASRVIKKFKTGTETYAIELIKALSQIDRQNDYLLYTPKSIGEKLPHLGENFKERLIPFGRLWTQFRLSVEMISKKPDVLFIPSHTSPPVHPKKTIVTIHDLGFKHFPNLYSPSEILYHNWAMNHAIKSSSHIIAISKFTKKDILTSFTIDPAKITVIYEGYDEKVFRPDKTRLSQNKPYILFVGRLEEKKNITGMIKAYDLLRKEPGIKHQFVLTGRPGFGYDKIKSELAKLPSEIRKDIILTGYVSQERYISLLKNADVLFFCTLFEGFGLPPLEAMASGIPVVASNRTSLPEIIGKAGLLVNPEKPFEMAVVLSKLINSKALQKALISKGLARASMFSWKKTAEQTLKVLTNL